MAKRKNPELHDKMVKELVKIMEEKNHHNIKADIKGYDTPKSIYWKNDKENSRIPDATSGKDGYDIFEVETKDSINTDHTKEQWELFAAHAKNNSSEFWIVVPEGSAAIAEKRVDELNITAEVAEISI